MVSTPVASSSVYADSQIFFLSAYFLPELYSTNTYVPISVEDPVLDAKNFTLQKIKPVGSIDTWLWKETGRVL